MTPYIEKADYRILDITPEHDPDIVGDIHALPFSDGALDAIICIAVLEHVANPWIAARELSRTLKPGGYLFVHVPFLFYYHTHGDVRYGDYWRFSENAIRLLFSDFSQVEIEPARGPLETWVFINPIRQRLLRTRAARFLRKKGGVFQWIARVIDTTFGKRDGSYASGYNAFLVK